MRRKLTLVVCACALAMLAWGQEGHPLTGSWHGSWTPGGAHKVPVLMFMKWDSKNITGAINPGPNAMALKVATLDATNWTVHFEAEGKDGPIVIDGKLENIGSYNRTITGTWTQSATKGDFKITRD